MYGIKHSSLTTQKESGALKGFLRRLIYFLLLNLSPRNAVLSRGTRIMSSKSRTGALVAETKPMRDTFAPTHSRGSYLGCWPWKAGVSGFLPGDSGLPGESGFIPDTPGHKASTTIFWVRGYKSPLHPFIYFSPCHFHPELLQTSFTPPLSPFGSKLVRFVVGVKRI
jgi:hypothetical protein